MKVYEDQRDGRKEPENGVALLRFIDLFRILFVALFTLKEWYQF